MTLPVFPSLPGLIYPVKRSVKQSTIKQDALSGKRTRYALQSYPTYAYEIGFSVLRAANAFLEWQTLEGFYKSVYGPQGLWQFSDPNDGAVVGQEFGVGDGATHNYQLVRTLGGFVEPVFAPVTGIGSGFTVMINGTPTTALGLSNGTVGFVTAPSSGAVLTWTGSFNWLCRFDDDNFDIENFMLGLFSMASLKFSTEKLF